jgi:uncharacterized membrane protein YfcA
MIGSATVLEVSAIMFVSSAFRTTFGFGEALVAVPLLSLILPVQVSAPIAVLASILIAGFAVIRDREHIHFSSARKLIIATAFGIPFGLVLLRFVPEWATKATLGSFVLLFSAISLVKTDLFTLKDDRFAFAFGFIAGVTGGSYGMNGPPLAIYGASRQWPPQRFRATIQAYFLPASLLGMLGYWVSGLWTKEVNVAFLSSLPAIIAGIFAGRHFSRVLDKGKFERFLYGALILVSFMILSQSRR